MLKLIQAADIILKECLQVKKQEKVLIITDKNKLDIADILLKQAEKISNAKLIQIPVGKIHGQEPPAEAANEMKDYDVILIPTTMSLTHTKASRNAAEQGARIASMPGINKEMMQRAINLDYEEMARTTNKIKEILDKGKQAKITTQAGTDITFSIDKRKAVAGTGLLREKGLIGNLPAGEAYIAPIEGTVDGKIIVDGSIINKKIENPITIIIENGFAVRIDGNKEADELTEFLTNVKDKNAYNLAELGIGTNEKAIVTGNILEDEKAKGTCHLALGNNIGFGGKTDVPVHIDGIILSPTIFIDGKVIIKDGKLL